jgi:hypothetical protein
MQPEPTFQFVTSGFLELGALCPKLVTRTTLLQDGRFVGQRFRCGALRATWSADSGLIEFYGANGELLRTVSLGTAQERKAA